MMNWWQNEGRQISADAICFALGIAYAWSMQGWMLG